jgi:hypothetical protein
MSHSICGDDADISYDVKVGMIKKLDLIYVYVSKVMNWKRIFFHARADIYLKKNLRESNGKI